MKQRRWLLLLLTLLLAVIGTGGWLVSKAKRQYALNRQLIAALAHNDSTQALALVNAGADPNTRFNPPPAPTLKLLLDQLMRRKPLPADDSPTAFMLVCGEYLPYSLDGDSDVLNLSNPVPIVEAMIAHGANVNAKAIADDTPLQAAVYLRDARIVELLLDHGANVNQKHYVGGGTCLIDAARIGCPEEVHLLLAHGADANAKDSAGRTALHNAIHTRLGSDIVRDLLAHGADTSIMDIRHMTPLMIAQQHDRPDLVELLRKHGK